MTAIATNSFGWKRDTSDERDFRFSAPRSRLPKTSDLRARMSAVKHQGTLGSCTGHASISVMQYLYPSRPNMSRLMAYYNGRAAEGTVNEDAGAQIRSVVKALAKVGVCRETMMPYDIKKFTRKPTAAMLKDAERNRIGSYSRITSLNALRGALADGNPVIFGFWVYESFESEALALTGIMQMPGDDEQCLGGHAVVAVGYCDKRKMVLVRNSWGSKWGEHGYFWMPYEFIENKEQAEDFWTMQKAA